MQFDILHQSGHARRARLHTAHGVIDTPSFMPVGTQATVKAVLPVDVAATGAQVVLGNAYHLFLRPGAERVHALGGLHAFMGWEQSILTDSGGFQVMSLAGLRKISESGVRFRSHIDGGYYDLTAEESVRVQYLLGADISMVFDECLALPAEESAVADSMRRSMRWAERSKQAFREREGYGLFGIVQGGLVSDFRLESAAKLVALGFDGYAIGGLAVGESQAEMQRVLDVTVPALPPDKPRYLMGVGKPADIIAAVRRGIDMFDCVLPTRCGRNGQAFVRGGTLNLRNAGFADDSRPLDESCVCPACKQFSRAYLHHLIKAKEILAPLLLSCHNLQYYQDLMRALRHTIAEGTLENDSFNAFP